MCQAIQEMKMKAELAGERRGERRGKQKGERNGVLKKAKEDARNFYSLGVDIEIIAKGVGYTVETIREWLGLSCNAS